MILPRSVTVCCGLRKYSLPVKMMRLNKVRVEANGKYGYGYGYGQKQQPA